HAALNAAAIAAAALPAPSTTAGARSSTFASARSRQTLGAAASSADSNARVSSAFGSESVSAIAPDAPRRRRWKRGSIRLRLPQLYAVAGGHCVRSGRRLRSAALRALFEDRDRGQALAFEELEKRAAAGRDIRDVRADPELLDRGERVAAAGDRERAARRDRFRDAARAGGELRM